MKITLFTSNQPRHINFVNKLSRIAEVYAFIEANTIHPGEVRDFYLNSPMMKDYFDRVKSAEEFLDKHIMNMASERDADILKKFGLTKNSSKIEFNKAIEQEQIRLTEKYGGLNGENIPPKDNFLPDLE